MKKLKVFCIPFAGGSEYSFFEFKKRCPDSMEIVPIALPGRGRRIKENRIENIFELCDDIYNAIKIYINELYVIYGHSMGGLISALLVEKITKNGDPLPLFLFVSGCASPVTLVKTKDRHLLPDREFIDMLFEMGGSPREILENKDLLSFFLPVLRSDFKAVDHFVYKPFAKLNVNICVMIGTEDDVTLEEAQKWQELTTETIIVKEFYGDHFFIYTHIDEILSTIKFNSISKL